MFSTQYTKEQLLAMPVRRVHVELLDKLRSNEGWENAHSYYETVDKCRYSYGYQHHEVGTDGIYRYIEVYDDELNQVKG